MPRLFAPKTIQAALLAFACLAAASCNMSPEAEKAAIEREILENPDGGQVFVAIKEHYPEDLDALVDQLHGIAATNLDPAQTEARAREITAEWMQAFMARIAADATKAPAEQLLAWSAIEAEVYETLQRGETEACAQMTMGGWAIIDDNNKRGRSAIMQRNIAIVRAAAAGRDDPQIYAEPSEEEFAAFGDAIAATGVDPQLQATLGDEAALLALGAPQQCEIGVAYAQGIAALPDDIEPRMAAFLFAPE